jgi:hypothetical protein
MVVSVEQKLSQILGQAITKFIIDHWNALK